MTDACARKSKASKARPKVRSQYGGPSYQRRLVAAGLVRGADAPAQDIDEFRNNMARRIAIFLNTWHGCPEPLCKRNRGCMAPRIHCSNAPPVEATPEELAETLALFQRMLREKVEENKTGGGT